MKHDLLVLRMIPGARDLSEYNTKLIRCESKSEGVFNLLQCVMMMMTMTMMFRVLCVRRP